MKRRIVYRNLLIVFFVLGLAGIVYFSYRYMDSQIPDNIHILKGTRQSFDFAFPVEAEFTKKDIHVFKVEQGKVKNQTQELDFSHPFTIQSNQVGDYDINLKLFGLFNWKTINVSVIDSVKVIPGGCPIGIYIQSDGILVLGTSSITCEDGLNYEPALDVLKSGDYITKINEQVIKDKSDLIERIQREGKKEIILTIRREDKTKRVTIKPVKTMEGDYKIGTWIRDDTQGIGTLTYIDLNGSFGALGHGITDVDTNLLMEINQGTIYNAEVLDIIKGKNGTPGEIVGLIKRSNGNDIGHVNKNTNQGIFGTVQRNNYLVDQTKAIPIGLKQDIKRGKATILCSVEGKIKEYEIRIDEIQLNNRNLSKGLVIEITDPELLKVTNGIVQGMSGSPIIQNGKIIGAVTHVFIQDSTKGYGTFIENMIKTAKE